MHVLTWRPIISENQIETHYYKTALENPIVLQIARCGLQEKIQYNSWR